MPAHLPRACCRALCWSAALWLSQAAVARAAAAPVVDLEAPLDGLYVTLGAGPSLALHGARIPADPSFPQLGGADESLGGGAMLGVALGLDLAHAVAIEVIGGADVLAGRRTDRVRALSFGHVGAGVRLRLDVQPRLRVVLAPHVALVRVDDAVAAAALAAMLHVALGVEYAVHVRHVTVGVEVAAAVPLSPLRVALGLVPYLRYTF